MLLAATCVTILFVGCTAEKPAPTSERFQPLVTLSSYGLFHDNGSTQEPVAGVIPYDINSALFSDYTEKYRFVKLPAGTSAQYHPTEDFQFPVGTIIAKTFAYPHDLREPHKGRRLLETRLLIHRPEGWIGLPYVWNAEQTEAVLEIAGGTIDARWIHSDGQERRNNYIVPNVNQCKGCHQGTRGFVPIGPKARHLNRDFVYQHGVENQLQYWTRKGILNGAPSSAAAPRLAVWDNPQTGTLEERARAWMEINCAHCHSPDGPARNSALDLLASQANPLKYGVYKAPVAAGRGSGGRKYSIVPGRPDESILAYRIASTHPGVAMPELGKRLIHEEGVALIRDWIAAMPEPPPER